MAQWKGIVGRGFRPQEFKDYVATLSFGDWRPQFAVVHNTSEPRLTQWHSHPGEERMRNLECYYREQQKWSGGPHLFVADDLIWVFSPLTGPGVHTPSWNAISWGIEMVGEYDEEIFNSGVRENVVDALAALHLWRGIDPETLRFHKEDPRTTHTHCPGKNVDKADLIERVRARMRGPSKGEHRPEDNYLKIGAKCAAAQGKAIGIRRAIAVSAKAGKYELRNQMLAADPVLQAVAATDVVLAKPLMSQRVEGIATIQRALNQLAAANGDPAPISLGQDEKYAGFFGGQTESAIRVFQQAQGLEPDGKVGDDTLCAIDDALEELSAPAKKSRRKKSKPKPARATKTVKRKKSVRPRSKPEPSATAPDGYMLPAEDMTLLRKVDFAQAVAVGQNYRDKFARADRGEARDDPSRCRTVLRFPGGEIFFEAKMAICTDGSPRGDKIDPSGQTETAHTLADGKPFDAEKIPYVVLPMPDKKTSESFLNDMGLRKGDLAMVIYRGERCGAILAELGPVAKIGETSVRTHELLPVPSPWKTPQKNRITNVSVPEAVLYLIFPNTSGLTKSLTLATAPVEVPRLAEEAFAAFALRA